MLVRLLRGVTSPILNPRHPLGRLLANGGAEGDGGQIETWLCVGCSDIDVDATASEGQQGCGSWILDYTLGSLAASAIETTLEPETMSQFLL